MANIPIARTAGDNVYYLLWCKGLLLGRIYPGGIANGGGASIACALLTLLYTQIAPAEALSQRSDPVRTDHASAPLIAEVTDSHAPSEGSIYSVQDIGLGMTMLPDSTLIREYRCAPSTQFEGFTWCTKQQSGKEARGNFEVAYSFLRSADNKIVYVNRFQSPAYWGLTEVQDDIRRYSLKIGAQPHVIEMPERANSQKGILAVWGNVVLQPLDEESLNALVNGRAIKKGILVDFIGDFTRSAQNKLPVFRLSGGPGFVWAASFDGNGRGTLRFFAANSLAFSGPQITNTSSAPSNEIKNSPPVPQNDKAAALAYADADPSDLDSNQKLRNKLFEDLRANTTKYTFDYVVINLPPGTLPGINVSVPVSHIRYSDTVFFAFDQYSLQPSAQAVILDFANTMLKDKSYKSIIVVGHTDSVGTDQYNYVLSKNRAAAVATTLRADGILDKFLGIVPMGMAQPRTTNSTPEGRALNRRVEFFISDIPGATKAAIEQIKYNPCFRNDNQPASGSTANCTGGPVNVPILHASGDGRPIATVNLSRSALPFDAHSRRAPLPNDITTRPSIKELQLEP